MANISWATKHFSNESAKSAKVCKLHSCIVCVRSALLHYTTTPRNALKNEID